MPVLSVIPRSITITHQIYDITKFNMDRSSEKVEKFKIKKKSIRKI